MSEPHDTPMTCPFCGAETNDPCWALDEWYVCPIGDANTPCDNDGDGLGFTEERVEEIARDAFRGGARMTREMMARFVEQGGDAATAASIRANWNPNWGADPGTPPDDEYNSVRASLDPMKFA